MSDVLKVSVSESGVATLLLNRPDKRNALNSELMAALSDHITRASDDAEVRVIAIRGAGKDFCAGLDLAELAAGLDQTYAESVEHALRFGHMLLGIRDVPKPVIALVQGRALAGGAGIATACDLILADEGAALGYPEIHLGFVPAMVMTILRRRVGEAAAFELATRGHRISAGEARELGLVTRTYKSEEFDDAVVAYLDELAAKPPQAMALTKRLFYELDGLSVDEGIRRGAEANAQARQTDEFRSGVTAFLERTRK